MLVLSRQCGEEVYIANGLIKVQVIEVRGTTVRLGFSAPVDIKIFRKEIALKIAEQERLAEQSA